MLGQIGTPGGGFGLSYHFANGGNPTRRAAVLASMQGSWQGGVDAVDKIPVARIVEALENPGGFISTTAWTAASRIFALSGGRAGELYPPSGYQPPDPRLAETGAYRDFRMLLDRRGAHADIVLPATTSFERNDLTMTGDYSNQHLVPMKRWWPRAMKRAMISTSLPTSASAGKRAVASALPKGKPICNGWRPSTRLPQRGAAQGVTLPPFAEFWEANQLIEMPESEQNAKFVRFADFRRDPQAIR
jgi:biotin/methionine sulfoxide reductase